VSAVSLFLNNKNPTTEQIKEGISGNLCRCTGYNAIVEGIDIASKKGAGQW
jgi:carbon-monoxide dehydrogenase small subunit